MIEQSRHVPLRDIPWGSSEVAIAIDEIVADALMHFDHNAFWPAHPLDDEASDGNSSIYIGAAGVVFGSVQKVRTDISPRTAESATRPK